jgi:hypothetical protein
MTAEGIAGGEIEGRAWKLIELTDEACGAGRTLATILSSLM